MEFSDVMKSNMDIIWLPVFLGFVISAIVGFFAIKMVAWLIKSDKFKIFAYYTLAVGAVTIGIGIFDLFVK